MTKTVVAVAAHADDEILGAGGTLAKHARSGDRVHIVFMTDGVGSRGPDAGARARAEAAGKAADVIGAQAPLYLDFSDNRMDSVALLDIVQALEPVLDSIGPQIIYTHHSGDLNVDHRAVHQAVLTACRPMPGSVTEAIYGFEVLSSTEWAGPHPEAVFIPQHYVDITDVFEQKMEALRAYDMEMRDAPHSRSYAAVEALATLRGHHAGLQKAEAFTVIRQISQGML